MHKIRRWLWMLLFMGLIAGTVCFAADRLYVRLPFYAEERREDAQRTARDTEEPHREAVMEISEKNAAAATGDPVQAGASEKPGPLSASAALAENGYAFTQLDGEDWLLYEELFSAVRDFAEEVVLTTRDAKRVGPVFSCVLADHPEIFYVDGYTLTTRALGEEIQEIRFRASYTLTEEQARERCTRIEEAVRPPLLAASKEEDDYEKLKILYDFVVENTQYSLDAPENQTICSVFLYGQSVCQGYAKAFQYLCSRAGIPAVLATGTGREGQPHAWTVVFCSGQWYHADPTWGDVSYQTGGEEARQGVVNYDYFLVPTAQISATHTADGVVPLPECTSISDSYYVREDLYFTEADKEQTAEAFRRALQDGKEAVTLKCADWSVYEQMYDTLLEQQEIFRYLPENRTVSYAVSEEQLTLTFFL